MKSQQIHQLFIQFINYAWYLLHESIEEGRLPKEVLEWRPSGRRKRGTSKLTWAEGIRGIMGEKEEDRTDRNNWRRKIA
jgi:hypothetical protein